MIFIKYIFNKLSVGQKILIVIAVEILSYSTITAIAIYQIHLMGNEIRQMANTYIPLLSATTSIRHQVQDERWHFKDIVGAGERGACGGRGRRESGTEGASCSSPST